MRLGKSIIYIFVELLLLGCSNSVDVQTSHVQTSSTPKATVGDKSLQSSKQSLQESKKQSKEAQLEPSEVKKPTSNNEIQKKQQERKVKEAPLEEGKPNNPKEKKTESNISTPHQQKKDRQTADENKAPLPTKSQKPKAKSQNEKKTLIFPEFYAPDKFKHPLRNSKNLTFMIGEDSQGSYLYGEGAIIAGAYEKFLKYVKHFEALGIKLDRLMIHSPGGVLNEGIKIGEYVQENKWTTDADKYMRCYSTCGFIYAAGIDKRIQTGAEVGFHRPYLPQVEDTSEFINKVYNEYQGYWRAVGGSPGLYDKFMREYGREDMYILDSQNIRKYMHVEKY